MTKAEGNGFHSEDHFQIEAFKWAWNTFPLFRRTFFHPANEGEKNLIRAKRDESKGLLEGAADFIFLVPTFAIELKQPGGRQTPGQKRFEEALVAQGIPYYLVFYMKDFQEIVRREFARTGI